jgi:RNA polymerase sigma-70 factor (ECF subfamily)
VDYTSGGDNGILPEIGEPLRLERATSRQRCDDVAPKTSLPGNEPEPFVDKHLMSNSDNELNAGQYQQLRRLAAYYMKMERCGHTLQPTALVHEAYLRVHGGKMPELIDQKQIVYVLACAMRHILVDYARHRSVAKRTPPKHLESMGPVQNDDYRFMADLLTINEALSELREISERQVQVVELRYFAGMTEDETADVLSVSRETVKLDWRFARAWIKQRLERASLAEASA